MKRRKSISRIISLVLTMAMLGTDISGSTLVASAQENIVTQLPDDENTLDEGSQEESPVGESPVEESSAGETPVEESSAGETPVEESSVGETPVDESSVEETPVEESSEEETPVEESSEEETPAEESSVEETPAEESSVEETPVEESSMEESSEEESSEEEIDTSDIVLTGNITLPEGVVLEGGTVTATVKAVTENDEYTANVVFSSEQLENQTYQIACPYNETVLTQLSVYLEKENEDVNTNLVTETYFYMDSEGKLVTDSSLAASTDLTEKEIQKNIVLIRTKTVSGTVSIPQEAYFSGGDYTGTLTLRVDNSSYSYEFTIPEGETSAEYSIELPADASEITYISAYSSYTVSDTNLIQDTVYCGNDGVWKTSIDSLEPISIEGLDFEKNIVLDCIHTLTGTVIVPEDATFGTSGLSGVVNIKINGSIQSYNFSLPSDDEIKYSVQLPIGTTSIDSISVNLTDSYSNGDINTNLLLGSSYYSAQTNTWGNTYADATAVEVPLINNVLDVELKKAVILSGTISLDEESYYAEAPLSGYFRVYVDGVAYNEYYRFENGVKSHSYKMQLPVTDGEITKVNIKNYANSQLDTDVITGIDLYLGEDGWTSIEENAKAVEITQDEIVLDVVLPKANIIKGSISLPSGISGKYEGEVVVISNDAQYKQDFVIEETSTDYKITLPQEKNQEYKLYYKLKLESSEVLALGKIFVNSETDYDVAEELVALKPVVNGTNTHDIKIAKWDSFDTENIFESQHPYEGAKNYSLSYVYPGAADAITLKFSKYTYVENIFDSIFIYDSKEELIGEYTGTQLAGKDIRIEDKGFKIEISADQNNSYYGFGIEKITVENAVPDNDAAFSLVYENDEVTKMVLHNTQENERSFYLSAADYDIYNKMISLATKKLVLANGMASIDLDIEKNPEANTSKLMLYDDKFVPICAEQYKAYPKYAVTYNYNDDLNSSRVVYVKIDEAINEPSLNPSRTGYAFTGWFTDQACTTAYEFGNVLTESITLYAGWSEKHSIITQIEGQGQIISEQIDGIYMASGKEITASVQPNEGWKFDSWQLTGLDESAVKEDNTLAFTMPNEDVVIKAVLKREMEVEWKSTGVYIDEKEITFNDQTLLVPNTNPTVTLQGSISDTPSPVTGISYTYSYYDVDEEGKEVYLTDSQESLATDEEGVFTLENLKVGVGTNTLVFNVAMGEETAVLTYYLIGNDDEVKLKDDVVKMDPQNIEDSLMIQDLATGIVAYWDYDNETPDYALDDKRVIIVDKTSEIAQRLMLPVSNENSIGIGSVWVIPACEQFASGYSFKIVDFGDADIAPEAPEGDVYHGDVFSAQKYLYMLVEEPDFVDVFDDSFSIQTSGVDGIAFSMLPENTVMECSLTEDDGNEVVATVGDMLSTASITRPGFQYQNLISNIIPKAEIKSNKIEVSFSFDDTVLYDKDGSENTTWDQLAVGGSIGVKDLSVESAFEYHPHVNLNPFSDEFGINVLPQQVGLLLEYIETKEFKVSLGGEIGGDPNADEDSSGQWSLKDVVKSFKQSVGCGGGNTKKEIDVLGIDIDMEGNDMDGTIVLAAVGFNLATMSPVASATYDQIATTSTFLGFSPIMVFMVCMDIDGSVSAKLAYTYSQETYNAKGFNIEQEGFRGTNGKIASLTPLKELSETGYDIEIFNVAQKSRTDSSQPSGKHTITATGEAKINTSLTAGAALLMCGLNIAQIKGGLYADANASLVGSAVFEKGQQPQLDLDGNLNISVGFILGFYSRLYAATPIGDFGYDAEWSNKWELFSWGVSSMGCSGIITEPAQTANGQDSPLSGVKVTLKKDSILADEETVYSDADGKYSFRGLNNGTYKLTFEKDGYVTKEEEIEISNISVRQNVSMSLASYMEVIGTVNDASTDSPLSEVSITLVKASDSSIVKYAITDENGAYKLGEKDSEENGLTPGVYKLTAKKSGYREVKQNVAVTVNETGVIEVSTINMIQGTYGSSTISGYIYDVATGRSTGVALNVTIKKGTNNSSGEVVKTMTLGSDGRYSFKVNPGYYTITVKDTRTNIDDSLRYSDLSFAVSAIGGQSITRDAYVSCAANDDQIRIVLTWGATPSDLDSHLLGPTADGRERFHTYYSNKTYYYGNTKYADLDLDDTTSYGPETTTIYYKNGSGIYSYYIHDYTNRSSSSNYQLGTSGATINVYKGLELISTHTVPQGVGTVWHVFDFDAATGEVIPVNTLTNVSDPGSVGAMSADGELTQEEKDLEIIFNDIVEK